MGFGPIILKNPYFQSQRYCYFLITTWNSANYAEHILLGIESGPGAGARECLASGKRLVQPAMNLTLASLINHVIRSKQVPDRASVARLCGVSRARVSAVVGLLGMAVTEQQSLLARRFKGL